MQPWRHAKSSAMRRQVHWIKDLAIHEFIDSSKTACSDLRHRIVLHNNDLGVFLAQMAFPERDDCKDIVESHIREDIGTVPSLNDWLFTAQIPPRSVARKLDRNQLIASAKDRIGLIDETPIVEVLDLLLAGQRFCPSGSEYGTAILMNGFGPFLVRQIIGPARCVEERGGREIIFDPSWTAEGIIIEYYGRIPSLSEVLAPFSGRLCE